MLRHFLKRPPQGAAPTTFCYSFRWPLLLFTVLLSACASKGNAPEPAALVEFSPVITPKVIWSKNTGKGTDKQYLKLSPVIADDTVYTVDVKGRVVASNMHTGKRQWQRKTKTPVTGGLSLSKDNNSLLLGTRSGEVIRLAANTTDKGSEIWRSRVSSEVLAIPQEAGGSVFAHAIDGTVTALDAESGAQLWQYQRSTPPLILRGGSAPIAFDNRVIVGFANGRVVALDLMSGQPIWEREAAVPEGVSELERMVDIDADPLIEGDVLFIVTYQGRILALDKFSGQTVWQHDMSSYTGMSLYESQLFVTDFLSHVWAFDRENGIVLWDQSELLARQITRPVVMGDTVVVGDFEGYLHWLSATDGHFLARTQIDKSAINTLLVHNDVLYVYTEKGTLSAVQL